VNCAQERQLSFYGRVRLEGTDTDIFSRFQTPAVVLCYLQLSDYFVLVVILVTVNNLPLLGHIHIRVASVGVARIYDWGSWCIGCQC